MSEEITGDLSLVELRFKLQANAGYKSDSTLGKARLYIDAARAIVSLGIEETEHEGERVRLNLGLLEKQLAEAERWLAYQSAASTRLPVYQPAADWRCE